MQGCHSFSGDKGRPLHKSLLYTSPGASAWGFCYPRKKTNLYGLGAVRERLTTWVASQVDPFFGQSDFDKDLIRDASNSLFDSGRDREADIRQKRKKQADIALLLRQAGGTKQTWEIVAFMSATDPKQTLCCRPSCRIEERKAHF